MHYVHSFVLINRISFSQFSFDWISFDLIDRGMDWIGLIWLKLDALCRLKSLVSVINTSCFSYSILDTITFRFDFIIMYMLCLVTIVIWLTVTVLCTYDFRPSSNTVWIMFNVILFYMHPNRE
jgi:hypothetical protein